MFYRNCSTRVGALLVSLACSTGAGATVLDFDVAGTPVNAQPLHLRQGDPGRSISIDSRCVDLAVSTFRDLLSSDTAAELFRNAGIGPGVNSRVRAGNPGDPTLNGAGAIDVDLSPVDAIAIDILCPRDRL